MEKGSVTRPYLGIKYRFISRDLAILNEVPQGAYIQEVLGNGPAQKSGVKVGDIITKIGDLSIDSEDKISEVVSTSSIGSRLELNVWRDGKELKLVAILEDLPAE